MSQPVSDFAQCRQRPGHAGMHAPGRERWTGYLDPARCDLLVGAEFEPTVVYCSCGWSATGENADELDAKHATHVAQLHE